MNITKENIGNVNAVIKVLIEKPDYEKTVEETLKDYRQNASIPGFRPGKAPMGLIRKRFGKPVLAEEINKMLSQSLTRYLMEEKVRILGEPLPNDDEQKPIDWDNDESFEFVFDVALAPEIEVNLSKEDKLDYFNIEVDDEIINQQVDMMVSQMGTQTEADEVSENAMVRGDFSELDDQGQVKEDGIQAAGVLLAIDLIKDDNIKNEFVGKKREDTLVFDPVVAYQDRHEVGHLLKISHEQADELNSTFSFKITEITKYEKAELNEEFFKKLYGEDTDVKTEEDFRKRISQDLEDNLKPASDRRFATSVRDLLIEKINPELPEDFLKRWLKETNKEVTDEQLEKDFDGFMKDLSWQLIKDEIAKVNELQVEETDAMDLGKKVAISTLTQYGMYNPTDEQTESFAKMLLEKPEEKERLYAKLLEDKVIDVVKEKITVENKKISREEFEKMD